MCIIAGFISALTFCTNFIKDAIKLLLCKIQLTFNRIHFIINSISLKPP